MLCIFEKYLISQRKAYIEYIISMNEFLKDVNTGNGAWMRRGINDIKSQMNPKHKKIILYVIDGLIQSNLFTWTFLILNYQSARY